MKQYFITAYDGTDEGALDRRMAARPTHLAGAKTLKENGNLITGGAILDENGKMIGSAMIAQFESEEAFQEWYDNEPYITQGVWKNIDVKPFRVANL